MHKPFYSNQKEMWEPLSYNIFIAGLFLNPLAFENSRRSVVQSPAPSVSNLKWPWTVMYYDHINVAQKLAIKQDVFL